MKSYGGPSIRKKFRGLKVTQTEVEQNSSHIQRLQSRVASLGQTEELSHSRSPTAKEGYPLSNMQFYARHSITANKP